MNVITSPHPTQPKPDPRSVRVFASEDERYYPTPPHPTKARPQLSAPNQSPTPAQCVCLQAKMNVITPPRPTPPQKLLRVRTNACSGEACLRGRT